jgi:hypothetical protein
VLLTSHQRPPAGDLGRLRSECLPPLLLVWADDSGTPVPKIELLPSYYTATLIEEPTEVEDPWDLPELRDTGIKWSGKLEATWGWQEGLDHCSVSPLSLFPPPFLLL